MKYGKNLFFIPNAMEILGQIHLYKVGSLLLFGKPSSLWISLQRGLKIPFKDFKGANILRHFAIFASPVWLSQVALVFSDDTQHLGWERNWIDALRQDSSCRPSCLRLCVSMWSGCLSCHQSQRRAWLGEGDLLQDTHLPGCLSNVHVLRLGLAPLLPSPCQTLRKNTPIRLRAIFSPR